MKSKPSSPPPVCADPCVPEIWTRLDPFCADEIHRRKNAVRISYSDITSAEFRRAIPNVRISDGCNQTDEIRRVAV